MQCPNCAETIPDDSAFCPECGHAIEQAAPEPAQPAAAPPPPPAPEPAAPAPAAGTAAPSGGGSKVGLWVAIAAIVVVAIGLFIVLSGGDDDTDTVDDGGDTIATFTDAELIAQATNLGWPGCASCVDEFEEADDAADWLDSEGSLCVEWNDEQELWVDIGC